MTQMRTIDQAIITLKLQDENCSLTKHALRQLIISQRIPSVKVGCKYLINMETLEAFLQGSIEPLMSQENGIRRLTEKIR